MCVCGCMCVCVWVCVDNAVLNEATVAKAGFLKLNQRALRIIQDMQYVIARVCQWMMRCSQRSGC